VREEFAAAVDFEKRYAKLKPGVNRPEYTPDQTIHRVKSVLYTVYHEYILA